MKKSDLKKLIKGIILESEFKPLPREARPYKCTVCGAIQSITTNHDGPVIEYCPKCSHSPSRGQSYEIPGRHKHCRAFVYDPSVNETSQKDIKQVLPKRYGFSNKWVPRLQMMTLDNLKAMKEKTRRFITYYRENDKQDEMKKAARDFLMYNDEIERRLRYINKPVNESTEPSIGGSYSDQSTDVSPGDITQLERDPLNDPRLNNKLDEKYRFDDFPELAKGDRVGIPVNVYYDTIFLGLILSQSNGYSINLVSGPHGNVLYKPGPNNLFKTKNITADALHRVWKSLRQSKETETT